MIPGLQLVERELSQTVIDALDKVGILYRLFSRVKESKSIAEKIERKRNEGMPYQSKGKLLQDIIGIRVVTYFKDDVNLVYSILNKKFEYISEEIDNHELTVFKPKRTNIICRLSPDHINVLSAVKSASPQLFSLVDNTFELQLRTILSEGWHEIDHRLRYKCKSDWDNHGENERMLNGIYASLETNDIALKSLFNELSYKHYQDKNWEGLLRNKFRLQFQASPLKRELEQILNRNEHLGKEILKFDRQMTLTLMSNLDLSVPITFNNLIFILNGLYLKNQEIENLAPAIIRAEFN